MTEAGAGWEALVAGRCDLVIGGPEPWPIVEGCQVEHLGDVELVLALLPSHPLARAPEPLPAGACSRFRMVAMVASEIDDHRNDARADAVVVDSHASRIDAIRHGLGIGFVPPMLAREDVAAGRLATKRVVDPPCLRLAAAWRTARAGRGVEWFLGQLQDHALRARLTGTGATRGVDDVSLAPSPHQRPVITRIR
jgi:DNA-binding transcriptional LysR family regulator